MKGKREAVWICWFRLVSCQKQSRIAGTHTQEYKMAVCLMGYTFAGSLLDWDGLLDMSNGPDIADVLQNSVGTLDEQVCLKNTTIHLMLGRGDHIRVVDCFVRLAALVADERRFFT